MLPYQEWSKRALLGFYKLLLSKQTDISETGMWKHTDDPLSLHIFCHKKWLNFESLLSPWRMSHGWPTYRWVIDWYGFSVGAYGCTQKTPQNFTVIRITVMNHQHLSHVCCTHSRMFCHLSPVFFTEVLPEVSFWWISTSGDAASFANSLNFCLSSCSYFINFLFLSHSYQYAYFFHCTCVSHYFLFDIHQRACHLWLTPMSHDPRLLIGTLYRVDVQGYRCCHACAPLENMAIHVFSDIS